MLNKNTPIKSKSHNETSRKKVSSRIIAEVVGCATCTVDQVQSGVRNADTVLGEKIMVAKMIIEEGFENVIINAKKILNK